MNYCYCSMYNVITIEINKIMFIVAGLQQLFILLLTCHSTAMDEKEWIPHTTKTGKILYYINPATGECKWQSQLTKVCLLLVDVGSCLQLS